MTETNGSKSRNKEDLVAEARRLTGVPKKTAETLVDGLFDYILESNLAGFAVKKQGFGTFLPSERKAREGRNPQTGESISIEASTTIKLKPSPSVKRAFAEKKNA